MQSGWRSGIFETMRIFFWSLNKFWWFFERNSVLGGIYRDLDEQFVASTRSICISFQSFVTTCESKARAVNIADPLKRNMRYQLATSPVFDSSNINALKRNMRYKRHRCVFYPL